MCHVRTTSRGEAVWSEAILEPPPYSFPSSGGCRLPVSDVNSRGDWYSTDRTPALPLRLFRKFKIILEYKFQYT